LYQRRIHPLGKQRTIPSNPERQLFQRVCCEQSAIPNCSSYFELINLIRTRANLDRRATSPLRRIRASVLIAGRISRIVALLLLAGRAVPAFPQESTPSAQSQESAPQTVEPVQSTDPSDPNAPGSIRGVIVNPDGAVYEGVHITLTLKDLPPSANRRTATTNSDGRFRFDAVPPGAFQLTASSTGFTTQTLTGQLHPGESYAAEQIVLTVAPATSQVEVTASREEIATAELHAEEQQRVFGVVPNFYVVYAPNPVPLNSKQKFHLAWRTMIDPFTFGIDMAEAGVQQANNDYSGFGQGVEGYAKRFGAAYGTDFTGTMIGGAILPSLLKQDPRYYYKGVGTVRSRTLYAIAMSVICKSDKGNWQPNYSSILGSLAAGGISNLYYPDEDRNDATLTFQNLAIGTAISAVQNIFQEFVVRKLTPKVPNYTPAKP